jgi:hypothetical protein
MSTVGERRKHCLRTHDIEFSKEFVYKATHPLDCMPSEMGYENMSEHRRSWSDFALIRRPFLLTAGTSHTT